MYSVLLQTIKILTHRATCEVKRLTISSFPPSTGWKAKKVYYREYIVDRLEVMRHTETSFQRPTNSFHCIYLVFAGGKLGSMKRNDC